MTPNLLTVSRALISSAKANHASSHCQQAGEHFSRARATLSLRCVVAAHVCQRREFSSRCLRPLSDALQAALRIAIGAFDQAATKTSAALCKHHCADERRTYRAQKNLVSSTHGAMLFRIDHRQLRRLFSRAAAMLSVANIDCMRSAWVCAQAE